ncbi:MAG: methyl-accepting chemotaxis protein [Zoogloeaceae bacterium]|jgi:methyl-accepting chemotaxis protein|nr:methyl-accepting chemotaxis protein [Zoogloeaceae bacterium]
MKIKTRIRLLSTISWLSLLVVGIIGAINIFSAEKGLRNILDNRLPKTVETMRLDAAIGSVFTQSYVLLARQNIPYEKQAESLRQVLSMKKKARDAAQKYFQEFDQMTRKREKTNELWERIQVEWPVLSATLGSEIDRLTEEALRNPTPEVLDNLYASIAQILEVQNDRRYEVSRNLHLLVDDYVETTEHDVQSMIEAQGSSLTKQSVITFVVVIVAIFLGIRTLAATIKPLNKISETVERVERERDLKLRVDHKNDDEMGIMVGSFNKMLSELQHSFQGIQARMGEVSGAVESLNAAAQQVASSSSSQSSSTSAMAASVEEMTVSIHTVTNSASDAQAMAERAGVVSDEGGQIIERTAAEMGAIAETVAQASQVIQALGSDSRQISSVVQVIKEVADQTNLLALNAAIEAARAGEQGRGFAVVADEVRKLAERTAQSTGDISAMIGKIQVSAKEAVEEMERVVRQVESGKTLAQNAGERIAEIREEAGKVSSAVTEISNALKEQSQASQDIARHVESIAQMTDENSAAAEETASGAQHLHQLSDSVSSTLAQFKV